MRMASLDDIAIHGHVLFEKADFVIHISEETSNLCCEVNDIRRLDAAEKRLDIRLIGKTSILAPRTEIKRHGGYDCFENLLKTIAVLVLSK